MSTINGISAASNALSGLQASTGPAAASLLFASMLSKSMDDAALSIGRAEEDGSGEEEENSGADLMGMAGLEMLQQFSSLLQAQSAGGRRTIVDSALSRVGDPYSRHKRGTGDYVDCSSLTQWAYGQAGISIPGTAAAQAKYCDENGFVIDKSQLQPGDLIFWEKAGCDCGRYKEIHHTGIYLGNGKIVDASSDYGEVVVRDLWGANGDDGQWNVVMYARPS